MSNSPLVNFTQLSPHCNRPRNMPIDTITIHCMAGNMTVESCGAWFANPSAQCSSNYGVDSNGRVGLYVEEINRSWATSSGANDNRAVTIEVANIETKEPFAVTDKAMATLIELCADICRRNNIKQLIWRPDKNNPGNMTVHRWFANKSCPGQYLFDRHGYIADEVNKRLGSAAPVTPPVTPPVSPPATSTLYRVRKSWTDAATQIGAYNSLANAKTAADAARAGGYKVFDDKGVMVYDPAQSTAKTPEEITVDNAAAAGILSDKKYWLDVLNGTVQASRQNIKTLIDNAVGRAKLI